MELITILSTIILIATISTFILSIGAYILYKIRSRREQKSVLHSAGASNAEFITVDEAPEEAFQTEAFRGNNEKTQFGGNDQEAITTQKRVMKNGEKLESSKSYTSRYKKYSTEKLSQSDNDYSSGELKWK